MWHSISASPWYNRNGWLGVKHQVTYLLNRCSGGMSHDWSVLGHTDWSNSRPHRLVLFRATQIGPIPGHTDWSYSGPLRLVLFCATQTSLFWATQTGPIPGHTDWSYSGPHRLVLFWATQTGLFWATQTGYYRLLSHISADTQATFTKGVRTVLYRHLPPSPETCSSLHEAPPSHRDRNCVIPTLTTKPWNM